MIPKDVQRCFEKICENYGVQASINITEPLRDREYPDMQVVFIDMMVGSHFSTSDQEILMNIIKGGIKSRKDYRKLRALVRLKVLSALRSLQDLAEDGIRNLGAKP